MAGSVETKKRNDPGHYSNRGCSTCKTLFGSTGRLITLSIASIGTTALNETIVVRKSETRGQVVRVQSYGCDRDSDSG